MVDAQNLTEYFYCGLRKSKPRISVAVCHQKRCLFLESEASGPEGPTARRGGKVKCGYKNYATLKREKR